MNELLYEKEKALREQGYRAVCGIDEAGRGPLAGPVYAAAVILPPDAAIEGLNDSKKLTDKKRRVLAEEIKEKALAWAVGNAIAREIDEINILQATFLAMKRALRGLGMTPDFVIVDGNRDPKFSLPTECIVKGDGKCAAIAAASILAKVARDECMENMAVLFPGYDFEKHKGYPTKAHYERIFEKGPCPIHRRSFLKNLEEHR